MFFVWEKRNADQHFSCCWMKVAKGNASGIRSANDLLQVLLYSLAAAVTIDDLDDREIEVQLLLLLRLDFSSVIKPYNLKSLTTHSQ